MLPPKQQLQGSLYPPTKDQVLGSFYVCGRIDVLVQGCGIKGFFPTSVIQGNLPFIWGLSLWEALFVVSQKWSFPTALFLFFQ